MYLNPELRKAWFPSLGYVGNFILKSSRKTLQIRLCPCDGSGHLCLLCIREFGCNCHCEDWLPRAAALFRLGATFHCHPVCCGTIQTRGNFSLSFTVLRCYSTRGNFLLPCSVLQTRGSFPSDPRLCISRVGSVLVEQWPFTKTVFENFYWGWLISRKLFHFPKLDHFLDLKKENFQCS